MGLVALGLLLLGGLMTPLAAQQLGDFTYSSDGAAITITDYTGAGGEVSIPDTVAGLPVMIVGNNVFFNRSSLTSVSIPNSITSIGDDAFSYCSSLSSVSIPDSVTSIGESAFANCSSLTSVSIPDSVTSIGNWAFSNCGSLTGILVEDVNMNYSSVEGVLFNKARTSLIQYPGGKADSYTIPDSVTSIGRSAFSGCSSLTSVSIPNSVTRIEDHTFAYCSSLTSVSIPDSVTRIEDHTFAYCSSLTSVSIPNSVTSIGVGAFYGCSSLSSVSIPDSVTSIGNWAFSNCSSLTGILVEEVNMNYSSVEGVLFNKARTSLIQYPGGKADSYTIPNSVTRIEDHTFAYFSSLTSVSIPDSVTSIGIGAFYGCSSLTSVSIPNSVTSIGEVLFAGCSSLTSVSIPNSVTRIEDHTFAYCSSLSSVSIPDSVTSIGDYTFSGCSSLTSVTFEGNAPTSFGTIVFDGTVPDFTIYYHEGSTGFTSPTWQGYPAAALGAPSLDMWRQQHFGATAATGEAADDADPDGDDFTNLEEFAAGTDPKNATSFIQVQSATKTASGYTVTLGSQSGRRYELQRLLSTPGATWQPVEFTGPVSAAGPVSLTDSSAPAGTALYRVRISVP